MFKAIHEYLWGKPKPVRKFVKILPLDTPKQDMLKLGQRATIEQIYIDWQPVFVLVVEDVVEDDKETSLDG